MIVEKTLHTQTIFTQGVAIGLGYIWLTANAEGWNLFVLRVLALSLPYGGVGGGFVNAYASRFFPVGNEC